MQCSVSLIVQIGLRIENWDIERKGERRKREGKVIVGRGPLCDLYSLDAES